MRTACVFAAGIALFAGELAAGCEGETTKAPTYGVTQTVPGVGTGGLSGAGLGTTTSAGLTLLRRATTPGQTLTSTIVTAGQTVVCVSTYSSGSCELTVPIRTR